MNSFDFAFIVLPLGIMIFGLVAGILLIVRRKEIEKERKISRTNAILKERVKNREQAEKQLHEIDGMLDSKSIDKDTYARLKTIVKMHELEDETGAVLARIWEE